jgi:hypothetical protein
MKATFFFNVLIFFSCFFKLARKSGPEEVDICEKLHGPMAAAAMRKRHEREREQEGQAEEQRKQEHMRQRKLSMDQDVVFIRRVRGV